jgi:hypothetical protein
MMPDERPILQYATPTRSGSIAKIVRAIGLVACCAGLLYGVLWTFGGLLTLWDLFSRPHAARFRPELAREGVVMILIGLVAVAACTRWLLAGWRGRGPRSTGE